jgi:hypothetical protein
MVGGITCFNPDHGMARCAVVSEILQSMLSKSSSSHGNVLNISVACAHAINQHRRAMAALSLCEFIADGVVSAVQ